MWKMDKKYWRKKNIFHRPLALRHIKQSFETCFARTLCVFPLNSALLLPEVLLQKTLELNSKFVHLFIFQIRLFLSTEIFSHLQHCEFYEFIYYLLLFQFYGPQFTIYSCHCNFTISINL